MPCFLRRVRGSGHTGDEPFGGLRDQFGDRHTLHVCEGCEAPPHVGVELHCLTVHAASNPSSCMYCATSAGERVIAPSTYGIGVRGGWVGLLRMCTATDSADLSGRWMPSWSATFRCTRSGCTPNCAAMRSSVVDNFSSLRARLSSD